MNTGNKRKYNLNTDEVFIVDGIYDIENLVKSIRGIVTAISIMFFFIWTLVHIDGRGGYRVDEIVPGVCITVFIIAFGFSSTVGMKKSAKDRNLVITNKRVFGRNIWGKRVDLPLDSISAVGVSDNFKTITITTSSGIIRFSLVENYNAVHKAISNLLIKRQQEKSLTPVITQVQTDETEKLKKYKELLDSGIITQEEFDAKKKQLLGL